MSIITLLTDFGLRDPYVAAMKGVILSINSHTWIVDITHQIRPQDIRQASIALQNAYRFFPAGTLHICVVDPGVGSNRSIVAVQTAHYIFLAPDNGLLWPILEAEKTYKIVKITNSQYYRNPVSRTFHGRDIFAPVGAHIANGIALDDLGPAMDKDALTAMRLPRPVLSADNRLCGTITAIDRFGNLSTNLKPVAISKLTGSQKIRPIVQIGANRIDGLSPSYNSVARHHPLAIIGSDGFLEIAVNCGNAQQQFGTKIGDTVQVYIGSDRAEED